MKNILSNILSFFRRGKKPQSGSTGYTNTTESPLDAVSAESQDQTEFNNFYNRFLVNMNTLDNDSMGLLLLCAAAHENLSIVKYLVSQGADINDGGTPLHRAAATNGDVEVVEYLSRRADVNAIFNYGKTPLHQAARYNKSVEILEVLVCHHGANVNAKDYWESTPLHLAAYGSENVEIVKYLVSKGADITARDCFGKTPLHSSVGNDNSSGIDIIKFLVSQGADINAKDNDGATPLHHAAKKDENAEIIEYFVSQGADINAKANNGETPLGISDKTKLPTKTNSVTIFFQCPDLYYFVLESPCNLGSKEERRLVQIAQAYVKMDGRHGVFTIDPAGVDESDRTRPISKAGGIVVSKDEMKIVSEELRKLGYEVADDLKEGIGDILKKKTWKEVGVDVSYYEKPYRGSMTYLQAKLMDGNFSAAAFVIEEVGADLNVPDCDGGTALHYAIDYLTEGSHENIGDLSIVKLLLDKGANPNAKKRFSTHSRTPLGSAWAGIFDKLALKNAAKIIELLVNYGADVNELVSENPSLTMLDALPTIRKAYSDKGVLPAYETIIFTNFEKSLRLAGGKTFSELQ